MKPYQPLTPESLAEGLAHLCAVDADLARIHALLGAPPMWAREPGFATLVHIVLEQQVSLASARVAFTKLQLASGTVSPERFVQFNYDELKGIGFSRQKARYCRGLAQAILTGELDLESIPAMGVDEARTALVRIKGIGPWTANIYLLMALLHPDIWPAGDLALVVAYQKLKQLPTRPGTAEMSAIAEAWSPWRAVAARLLWHFYLNP